MRWPNAIFMIFVCSPLLALAVATGDGILLLLVMAATAIIAASQLTTPY